MNIPGGQLANRFGAKPVIVTALVVAAIASFLTPMVVFLGGAPALITLRFIMGLSQGGLFPASNALLSAWAPLHERGRLASFIYCGAPVMRCICWGKWTPADWFAFAGWNADWQLSVGSAAAVAWLAYCVLRIRAAWLHHLHFVCELIIWRIFCKIVRESFVNHRCSHLTDKCILNDRFAYSPTKDLSVLELPQQSSVHQRRGTVLFDNDHWQIGAWR